MDPVGGAHIEHLCPSVTLILRYRDAGTDSKVRKSEIDAAGCINAQCRIITLTNEGRLGSVSASVHRPNRPCHAIVFRYHDRLGPATVTIGDVNGHDGHLLHMAV